jgi:hypothetical protein
MTINEVPLSWAYVVIYQSGTSGEITSYLAVIYEWNAHPKMLSGKTSHVTG